MRNRYLFALVGVVCLSGVGRAWGVVAEAAVDETANIGTTSYTVMNESSSPFDISAFAVTNSNGSSPVTSNGSWTAQSVDEDSWTDDMPGEPLTWAQYTNMSFAQAFPGSPNRLFGFFLNYTYDSDNNTISFPNTPVMPGGSLGGFSFTGSPESTWDVFGPNKTDADAPFTPSEMESATGTSTVTPEPAVMGVVAAGMVMGRRRRRVSGLRELNRQDAKTPRRSA